MFVCRSASSSKPSSCSASHSGSGCDGGCWWCVALHLLVVLGVAFTLAFLALTSSVNCENNPSQLRTMLSQTLPLELYYSANAQGTFCERTDAVRYFIHAPSCDPSVATYANSLLTFFDTGSTPVNNPNLFMIYALDSWITSTSFSSKYPADRVCANMLTPQELFDAVSEFVYRSPTPGCIHFWATREYQKVLDSVGFSARVDPNEVEFVPDRSGANICVTMRKGTTVFGKTAMLGLTANPNASPTVVAVQAVARILLGLFALKELMKLVVLLLSLKLRPALRTHALAMRSALVAPFLRCSSAYRGQSDEQLKPPSHLILQWGLFDLFVESAIIGLLLYILHVNRSLDPTATGALVLLFLLFIVNVMRLSPVGCCGGTCSSKGRVLNQDRYQAAQLAPSLEALTSSLERLPALTARFERLHSNSH